MSDRNVKLVRSNGRKPIVKQIKKTASTDFDKNSLVEYASGVVNPSDDNDIVVKGIMKQEIASTDSDYATTTKKDVQLLTSTDEVEIDTTAQLTVGVSYGISNAYTVDQSDTSTKVFTCTKVINSTRAVGYFKTYAGGNAE